MDTIEILIFLDPPMTLDKAVRQADGIRMSLVRSGYDARVADIRGDQDRDTEDA